MKRSEKRKDFEDRFSFPALLSQTDAVSESFFSVRTDKLARQLLGCVLLHGETAGIIVEAEAYLGTADLAAHSSRGLTERTKVIFGPPGRAYVYFIYGLHECLNVVAEPEGTAGCVLIRALDPVTGLDEMRRRRHWTGRAEGLANGPGKLTEALDITRAHYGKRLDVGDLTIRTSKLKPQFEIAATPRIGITQCADWPLRFIWAGHRCLSRKSP